MHVAGPHDFCVKDDGAVATSACGGDSGSPLVFKSRQIGLVSWGHSFCNPDFPSVATSVPYYYKWIFETCPECVGMCCCLLILIHNRKFANLHIK